MTQKELLYVEDAVNHEKNIIDIINDMVGSVEDAEIIDFIDKELEKHEKMKEKLLNLLEEKSNE
ncbi:MAG: hypothetical protein IKE73_01640 [Bacilli bacterium]|nr:hypothetical protein [Bacilli bacterium]